MDFHFSELGVGFLDKMIRRMPKRRSGHLCSACASCGTFWDSSRGCMPSSPSGHQVRAIAPASLKTPGSTDAGCCTTLATRGNNHPAERPPKSTAVRSRNSPLAGEPSWSNTPPIPHPGQRGQDSSPPLPKLNWRKFCLISSWSVLPCCGATFGRNNAACQVKHGRNKFSPSFVYTFFFRSFCVMLLIIYQYVVHFLAELSYISDLPA